MQVKLDSVRSVILASMLVALAAAGAIYGLNGWAQRSAATELRLTDLRSTLNAVDVTSVSSSCSGSFSPPCSSEMITVRSDSQSAGS